MSNVFSFAGAVALLSTTTLVAPATTEARPVLGSHAPAAIVFRAGRWLCYYPFGWRGPGYYPCSRARVAHAAPFPRVPHARMIVHEARRGHVVEMRGDRMRLSRGHAGGQPGHGHPGHGHPGHGYGGGLGMGHGGGHQMAGGTARSGHHRFGSGDIGDVPVRGDDGFAGRPSRDAFGHEGYGNGGYAGHGYPDAHVRGAPLGTRMEGAPAGSMRLGNPMGGLPGGGMRAGAPAHSAPIGGGMHIGGASTGGGLHVGAPMGGMHTGGAPATAPAMHMPAAAAPAPAMHMPAPAPAPVVHTPAPAPAPAVHH